MRTTAGRRPDRSASDYVTTTEARPASMPSMPDWLTAHWAWEHATRIPDAIRLAVLDRDNWSCVLCGTGGENRVQLHHWRSFRSHGGPHIPENLVTVCFRCHEDIHAGRQDVLLLEIEPNVWAAFPQAPQARALQGDYRSHDS
jgi:hypothetical protein